MGQSTPKSVRRAQVIRAWTASYDPALAVRVGQHVTPGRTDPDNPGWRWVEDAAGLGGWIPIEILATADDGTPQIVEDFNTRELTVAPGARLTVLAERHGWLYCQSVDGATGWLPGSHAKVT